MDDFGQLIATGAGKGPGQPQGSKGKGKGARGNKTSTKGTVYMFPNLNNGTLAPWEQRRGTNTPG